eukprot:gene39053-47514_t
MVRGKGKAFIRFLTVDFMMTAFKDRHTFALQIDEDNICNFNLEPMVPDVTSNQKEFGHEE